MRLTYLKELALPLKYEGMLWIMGQIVSDKDQLYLRDGDLMYKLYLLISPQDSKLISEYCIVIGTNQVFYDSIIVTQLLYLNINIGTYYDYYIPQNLIYRPNGLTHSKSLDQGTFVVRIEAKSEISSKGSLMDFVVQATIHSNDFSWLPSNLSYQAQKCCVCTVFIIFHSRKPLVI